MPPYDFGDLQVNGDFKNRPDTGKFSTYFPLRGHISYGRRRRLCTIISADAGAVRRFVRLLVKYTAYGGRR